jgi:two-component system chemotaxis response regulator CheY
MAKTAQIDALIVDDHDPSRALYARALHEAGAGRVREAEDAARALALLADEPASLILVDQMMPGMDGMEFVAAVRANPRLAHALIVMISGYAEGGFAEAARAAGADAVLAKPVTPGAVLRAIEALLGGR